MQTENAEMSIEIKYHILVSTSSTKTSTEQVEK